MSLVMRCWAGLGWPLVELGACRVRVHDTVRKRGMARWRSRGGRVAEQKVQTNLVLQFEILG